MTKSEYHFIIKLSPHLKVSFKQIYFDLKKILIKNIKLNKQAEPNPERFILARDMSNLTEA